MEEFNKFEPNSVDVTDHTWVLVDQMKRRDVHLIVTTIQKMSNAVKNPRYAKVMDEYKNEKVVFIIDECHRSQFGDMHRDIRQRALHWGRLFIFYSRDIFNIAMYLCILLTRHRRFTNISQILLALSLDEC
jgi:type I site-specific restriction-modification system R (restriction) subunit